MPEVEKKAVVKAAGADMIGVNDDMGKENEKKVENVENKQHRGTSSFQLSDEQPDDQVGTLTCVMWDDSYYVRSYSRVPRTGRDPSIP